MQKHCSIMKIEVTGTSFATDGKSHRKLPPNQPVVKVEEMKKEQIDKVVQNYVKDLYRNATWAARTLGVVLKWIEVPKKEDVISQGKTLFHHYIYMRLKKERLLSNRVLELGSHSKPSDVANEIVFVGSELERMHPELYASVVSNMKLTYLDESVVRKAYLYLAEELCKSKPTWARVVALFSTGGALAADCARKGEPELVPCIVDTFVKFTQRHLASWIIKQGGWGAVLGNFTSRSNDAGYWTVGVLVAAAGFLATVPVFIEY